MTAIATKAADFSLARRAVEVALPELQLPVLAELPRSRLHHMLAAAHEAMRCRRALEKDGLNLVGEVLRGQGEFYEYEHYPNDDVYDAGSHAQYYYHAHRGLKTEHGHFHTFLRRPGSLTGAVPLDVPTSEPWPRDDDEIAHLIAISMDSFGRPIGLFATNRWVTGETWFRASDVIDMLDHFRIDRAKPSWPVNRWIGAMTVLYRPYIEALLKHRDAVIAAWSSTRPDADVFEDRELEITGQLDISVDAMAHELQRLLAALTAASTANGV